jgi:hypothetical protein
MDLRAFSSQHPKPPNVPPQQVFDGVDLMGEGSLRPVEFPDHQHVTLAQRQQTGFEARPIIPTPRGAVFVNLILLDAIGVQAVVLQVWRLRAVGFRDASISDRPLPAEPAEGLPGQENARPSMSRGEGGTSWYKAMPSPG